MDLSFAFRPAPWRRRLARWVVMRSLLALASHGSCGAGALPPNLPSAIDAVRVATMTAGPVRGRGEARAVPRLGAECS